MRRHHHPHAREGEAVKLHESAAWAWHIGGIATVCVGLALMRAGQPLVAGFIGGAAVWMGRRAGRAEIRSAFIRDQAAARPQHDPMMDEALR